MRWPQPKLQNGEGSLAEEWINLQEVKVLIFPPVGFHNMASSQLAHLLLLPGLRERSPGGFHTAGPGRTGPDRNGPRGTQGTVGRAPVHTLSATEYKS